MPNAPERNKPARCEWDDVLAAEQDALTRRPDNPGGTDYAGLAISGGGIRSATFALGVLESLKEHGFLSKFHYLSTVSGGGYIGSWLTANCRRRADWLTNPDPAYWTKSIEYLSKYSNYLSPQIGFFSADTWSIVTIWLRNTILIQTTVILAIACCLLAPRPLFALFLWWPRAGHLRWLTVILFIVGIVGIAGSHWQLTTTARDQEPGELRVLAFLRALWAKITSGSSLPTDASRFGRPIDLLSAESSTFGTLLAIVFFGLAMLVLWVSKFDPFAVVNPPDFSTADALWRIFVSVLIAGSLISSGFCLQPVAVQLVAAAHYKGWFKLSKDSNAIPTRVNFTQFWVQVAVVIPLMMVAFLITSVLWAQATVSEPGFVTPLGSLTTYSQLVAQAWKLWPFHLTVVFVSFWLLSLFDVADRGTWRGRFIALAVPAVAVPTLHAMLAAIALVFQWFNKTYPVGGAWMAFVWGPAFVSLAFVLSIVVLIGIQGRDSSEGVREWWSRLGAWLAIYAVAWMVIAIAAVYGPLWLSSLILNATWQTMTGLGGWVGTVAGGLMAGNSGATGRETQGTTAKAKDILARVAPFVFIAGLLLMVSYVLHLIVGLNGGVDWWNDKVDGTLEVALRGHLLVVPLIMFGACFALMMLLAWRVDINLFSLNTFYRNRLVRCYLGATREPGERHPQNFTGFDDADDLPLAFTNDNNDRRGPFHIINCALNLGGSSDLALHTRHSASFTMSPTHCGSAYVRPDSDEKLKPNDPKGARHVGPVRYSSYVRPDSTEKPEEEERKGSTDVGPVGYVATASFGHRHGGPLLGQAVSVSGAAASPNMGYHTSALTAFLLTVFNVRLGWWFPNPRKATGGSLSPHLSLSYLWAELFGLASDRSPFVMVSDGGHFENLATYELIRRKCRLIVISDAECDVNYTFEGLGTLIRVCEVDFKCHIDINVDEIRPTGQEKWSQRRFTVGTITYKDDPVPGVLIYLKASMTGTSEDMSVRQYKSSHHDFPHETTGDQFYGEDQFESYRRLGRDIANEVFKSFDKSLSLADAAVALSLNLKGM
jgi:patatin-like phospholipase